MSLDVYLHTKERDQVYWANITHNLGAMAAAANIYNALWRPYRLIPGYDIYDGDYEAESEFEENNEIKASEIISLLESGLQDLKNRPDYFKTFDSPNGWGTYKHFVPFVENYLKACKQFPEAIIETSR